jgi:choline kinase
MDRQLDAYIISGDLPVIDAMSTINENARGIAFVCEGMALKGVVTDGNIRRYIIRGGDMQAPVRAVMTDDPKFINHHDNVDPKAVMEELHINAVPIVNSAHEVIAIQFLHESRVYQSTDLGVPVAVMAGGKGTRLLPLTRVLPKPLIPVGDRTILEIIMDRFASFGCDRFDVIVNYKRNLIKAFFEDSERNYDVSFTDETEYGGTGGGLSLLKGKYADTFFMTNCDILIEEDYGEILRHHRARGNILTMVTAMKSIPVDYGTVEVSGDGLVTGLTEKPQLSMLVNTGLYVIEPRFLD